MAGPDLDTLSGLMDEAKCFALVRRHRWPDGVRCPACGSGAVIRDGRDEIQPQRQRYRCKSCAGRFDDLTGTVLAGHHQPLRVWVLCLPFMGLNLANRQIAAELGLGASDVQAMTEALRGGLVAKVPPVRLEGEVEIEVHHLPSYSPEPSGQCPIGANFRGGHGIAPCRTGSFGVGAVAPGCGGRGWRLRRATLRRSTRHARR